MCVLNLPQVRNLQEVVKGANPGEVQLREEKETQIHLVAHATWMRVKKTGYLIADNGEAREV